MKRLTIFALGFIVVLATSAFAADNSVIGGVQLEAGKTAAAKIIPPKFVRMRATGKVTEISATTIMIDRTLKDSTEMMTFTLERPASSINIGDNVNVSYITKDGINLAVRVSPVKKYTIKPQNVIDATDEQKKPYKTSPSKEALPVKK